MWFYFLFKQIWLYCFVYLFPPLQLSPLSKKIQLIFSHYNFWYACYFMFFHTLSYFIGYFFILHFSSLKVPRYIFVLLMVILKLFTNRNYFPFSIKMEQYLQPPYLKQELCNQVFYIIPLFLPYYFLCTVKIILNFGSRSLSFHFVPLLFYEYLLNSSIKFHCHIFNNYLVLTEFYWYRCFFYWYAMYFCFSALFCWSTTKNFIFFEVLFSERLCGW